MKNLKPILGLFYAVLFIFLLGTAFVSQGASPMASYGSLAVLTLVGALFNNAINQASGYALGAGTIYRQVWNGELIKKMRLVEMYTWVIAIVKDYSQYVTKVGEEAEVINLASFPAEPDVLIDNNIYPIPTQDLPTDPLTLTLNKFQTKVTPITDDEVYANTTKKMENTTVAHTMAIMRKKFAKGAWNICPTGNTTATPVILATGDDDGTGRKMLTMKDLKTFKRKLDLAEVNDAPGTRILVLSTEHENDLVAADQKFADNFYNYASGKPYNTLNFTFYGYNENPYYHTTTLVKQPLDSVVTAAIRRCSMFFSQDRVGKANGTSKAYLAPSELNPAEQKATYAARSWNMITRLNNEGVGAIVSPNV
jgi:hypothetical protein